MRAEQDPKAHGISRPSRGQVVRRWIYPSTFTFLPSCRTPGGQGTKSLVTKPYHVSFYMILIFSNDSIAKT